MNLKKIKLNSFEESTLKDQEMNQIRGGNSCQDANCEPSSVACNECTTTTTSAGNGGEDSTTTPAF